MDRTSLLKCRFCQNFCKYCSVQKFNVCHFRITLECINDSMVLSIHIICKYFRAIKENIMSQHTLQSNLSFVNRVVPDNLRSRVLKNYFLILDKYDRGDDETVSKETQSQDIVISPKESVERSDNGTQTVVTKASKGNIAVERFTFSEIFSKPLIPEAALSTIFLSYSFKCL